jgi:ABC-type ATPase involved in cell division
MIRLDSVTKRYTNGFVAVQTLSMEIPAGDRFLEVLTSESVCRTLRRSIDEAETTAAAAAGS